MKPRVTRISRRRRLALTAASGALISAGAVAAAVVPGALAAPAGAGLTVTVADTHFILNQITLSEVHAAKENPACAPPLTVANCATPGTQTLTGAAALSGGGTQGVRQVDGRNNNLATGFSPWNGRSYNASTGNSAWGAADQVFPVLTGLLWRAVGIDGGGTTNYANRSVNLVDDQARDVSNLIVDQSAGNPAAVAAAAGNPAGIDGSPLIPNQAPAGGVAPPYNGMFALFGQFFDHGLDLVDKSSSFVKVNIKPGDPLFAACAPGPTCNAMYLSRTTLNPALQARNTTTPWIDQNQTYTSHPSHQFFLREYVCAGAVAQAVCTPANPPVATGKLADSTNPNHAGDLANWAEIKTQAHDKLGIDLADYDVNDVPIVLTDEYGRFIRGPQGFPLLVRANGNTLAEGNPAAPVATVDLNVATSPGAPTNLSLRTGHAFINDMSQGASPIYAISGPTWANDPGRSTTLGRHFVMGDGRGNENIGLTAIHTVFHAEHNRLVEDLKNVINSSGDPAFIAQWHVGGNAANDWDGERLLQGARLITEMEYQHLVFGEFARLVEPGIAAFTQYNPTLRPDISAEFAHAVYRFGHSMLNATVERELSNGTQVHTPLLEAFTNPALFNDNGSGGNLTGPQAAGAVARGMTGQVGNEMDEFVTNTLRNTLLGQPLDLATLNILRGRDSGTQPLNGARRALFASTNGDPSLAPYGSWAQFGLGLRHPQSLVNFVAAYGTHISITGAATLAAKRTAADLLVNGGGGAPLDRADFMNGTGAFADVAGKPVTGLEDIDLWVGGLAEKPVNNLAGSMLGPTFAYVFRTQLEHLQDSDRFYYLGRLAGTNLDNSIEGNTFAEMVMRNTDATSLPVNAFLHPTNIFDLNTLVPPYPTGLTNLAGKFTYSGAGDSVFTGTPGDDSMQGGTGDDTMRGNDGNDRVEGWLGNDNVVGGLGNDILTDAGGGNLFTAGDGNDYMAGAGTDQFLGGSGHDFMVGTSGATAMIGGPGNDLAYSGNTDDVAAGDDNSDWIDGGPGIDTLTGDGAPPFSIDLNVPGDDVISGDTGGDIVNGDGGVDLFNSVRSDEGDAVAGGFGFDFQTYGDAATSVTADLNLAAPPAGVVGPPPDTFLDVEGLSGGPAADNLSGDNRTDFLSATPGQTDNLNQPDIAKFRGMDTLLGVGATGWTTGNIILGGAGSDTIEGRGGNDLIDGDRSLVVRLSAPVTQVTATCPGITGTFTVDPTDAARVLVPQVLQLRQAVLAGCLDPGAVQYIRTIAPGAAGGADVVVYSGAKADYTVTGTAPRMTIVDKRPGSPDGTDTVLNAEILRFSDGDVSTGAPVGPAPIISGGVAPASLIAGATGKVALTVTTSQALPANGTIRVTFPAGFDLTNLASVVAVNGGLTGTANASVNGQVVTITRTGGASEGAGAKSVTLSGVTNPTATGPTGTFDLATTNATPSDLETGTAPAVTIVDVPAPPAPAAPAAPGSSGAPSLVNPTPPTANRPAVLSLGKSTASRKGRTVSIVVVPTNAGGAAVPWTAKLTAGRSSKTVTGSVPAGASRQVLKVTVPLTWTGRKITIALSPTAGGAVRTITVR